MVVNTCVTQSFIERFIAVRQVDILAHHRNVQFVLGVLHFLHQIIPALQGSRRGVDAQFFANQSIQALLVEHARHFVNGVHVPHGDDAPLRHIGEQRNFGAFFLRNRPVGTAQQSIGLDADFTQFLRRVLGGFGFKFASGGDPRHIT